MCLLRAASACALLCLPLAVAAQEPERGRLLYDTYCGECHYPRVHQRPREASRVKNLSDLRDIVASRAPMTKFRFSLDDQEDVVQYLNRSYYKLAK
jgi:mono/diheme cytochrome c family protein